jgi:phospholipid/cholesterol/gamma-HCH transport system substrate-binding protein
MHHHQWRRLARDAKSVNSSQYRKVTVVRDNLGGAIWRLTIFLVVCALGLFGLLAIFAQLRFQDEKNYRAEFSNVSGLIVGDFVRVAGVEVGKVKAISIERDSTAVVEFSTDQTVILTQGSKAAIKYDNLIGDRYLALEQGAGSTKVLESGGTIPLDRTSPALDLDALIGGFRPLFRALDPEQVNALSGQLIAAFQGQGPTINTFFEQTAALTNALADRDQLIGEVIVNLNTVLSSLGDRSTEFARTIDSLATLVGTLAERKEDVTNAVAYGNEAAATFADLLSQARPPAQTVVAETDRVSSTVLADYEYFDNLLATLPDSYRSLSRFGIYGDFFTFYLCDLVLKVNGKGGQPMYIKLAGQDSGRCAPR